MNKQDLISKIKQLDGISQDERAYLINLVNTKKKYGLVWEDKPEEVEEQLRENLPVLKEVKEKAIINEDVTLSESSRAESRGEVPNHILIEGDNLHALTALTFTHEGKIDVIYIDPPYNTGNKDFMYNDHFVDNEDSFRHSKWLSFMHRRLVIAKKLLNENGVVFISIDDNEQSQLKLLCDEVFNENNFVGNFIWVKKKKGSHLSKTLRSMTEYVLCYAKSIKNIELYGEDAYSDKWQPLVKRTNSIKELSFPANFIKTTLKDKIYDAGTYGSGTSSIKINENFEVKNGIVINSISVKAPFVWVQRKLDEEIKLGSEISLSSKFGFNTLRHNQDDKIKRPSSLINNENNVGTNEDAYQELIDIFNAEGVMTYPKPSSLIKYLINTITYFTKDQRPIILDFFAGTGTTLHATLELNEDGGNRQCILVTNNENNICEEVTYERNKRVIQGYTNAKGVAVEGLKNNNLRYYKSEFVPSNKSESNKRLLTELSTDLLCIKEDCYTLFNHQETFTDKECKIFTNGKGKFMVVVYHSRNLTAVCEQLQSVIPSLPATEKVRLYVFSPEKETLLEEFQDIEEHIIAVPLPEAIYNAYRATFKTLKLDKKPLTVPTPEDEPAGETDLFTNEEEA